MLLKDRYFVFLVLFLHSIVCQEYEYKCKVIDKSNQTLCDGDGQEIELSLELLQLAKQLDYKTMSMNLLEIRNSLITEISENCFQNLSFETIKIFEAQDLTRIHTNAFGGNSPVRQFLIDNPTNLMNEPPDYDLYRALNSLKNLIDLQISLKEFDFHTIPDNAFNETQNKLNYFLFKAPVIGIISGYAISRIGNNSFSGLSALTAISFRHIYVQNISSNAFRISRKSEQRLTINLEDCTLFDETIENNSFTGANRPVTVILAINTIEYIREEKFSIFLNENKQNLLLFYGNPLNCHDTKPFLWLLNDKQRYAKQILGAKCSNGTSIWNLDINQINRKLFFAYNYDYEYKCKVLIENNKTVCFCDANNLEFDIELEMQNLSFQVGESEKLMDMLVIRKSPITVLPENSFFDLAFESININDAHNLTLIHTRAFSDKIIAHLTKQFLVSSPSSLVNRPPDYDLFKSLNSLKNANHIQISLKVSEFHEIPDEAFNETQDNLEYLVFDSNNVDEYQSYGLKRIGSNSFTGLTNLSVLMFSHIPVKSISSDAFKFKLNSNEMLDIHLNDCGLTENTPEDDLFIDSQRPISVNLATNSFKYLREEKFSKFLNQNKYNLLLINDNPLDCTNRWQYNWLLDNEEDYADRVIGAYCDDGTAIWNLNDVPKDIKQSSETDESNRQSMLHVFELNNLIGNLIVIIIVRKYFLITN